MSLRHKPSIVFVHGLWADGRSIVRKKIDQDTAWTSRAVGRAIPEHS
jgi:hypothetical protein